MRTEGKQIAILTGPTAVGKSSLAMELVRKYPEIELIYGDSLTVYAEMDIGTAKPTLEDRLQVPHHLLDIRTPPEFFTAGDFLRQVERVVESIDARRKRVLIVGGSSFYLQSLLCGLWKTPGTDFILRDSLKGKSNDELFRMLSIKDEKAACRMGVSDRYRLIRALEVIQLTSKTPSELQEEIDLNQQRSSSAARYTVYWIDRSKLDFENRIHMRTQQMLQQGLVQEVCALRLKYGTHCRPFRSVGYAQVSDYLDAILPLGRKIKPGLEGLKDEINLATLQLVKKQRTAFRHFMGRMAKKFFSAQCFELERDHLLLEKAFHKVYSENP